MRMINRVRKKRHGRAVSFRMDGDPNHRPLSAQDALAEPR